MRPSVRVIVYNAQEDGSPAIRAELLRIEGVRIVAELDEIGLVEQAVGQFPAEILLMNLDPSPESVLPVAVGIASTRPEPAVFVLSSSADAQIILTAMRGGVREFLTHPLDRGLLVAAIGRISAASDRSRRIGRLISVFGTVGGVGASTIAANLAFELNDLSIRRPAAVAGASAGGLANASTGASADALSDALSSNLSSNLSNGPWCRKPVALVDLDFRYGQLATLLDVQADYTVADLCDTAEHLDAAMIEKAMVKHASGVHLLARPHQFSQADQITAAHCTSVLSSLQQEYGYVVVDGPMRFDVGGSSVLDLSDVNLFVMQLLVPSVRNVHRLFGELRANGYNLDRFRLVCNRTGHDSGHLGVDQVEKTLGKQIAYRIPDDWKTVSGSIDVGVPLIEMAPKSRVRAAIREIAESIAKPHAAEKTPENGGRAGLLGKIFSGAS